MKTRKALILLTVVLLSISVLLAGTYAWFYDSDRVENKFEMANLGAHITEIFVPKRVVPGMEIKKDVTISNSASNMPILVRVRFEEVLRMLVTDTTDNTPLIGWQASPGAPGSSVILEASDAFITHVQTTANGWEKKSLSGYANLSIYRRVTANPDEDTQYTYFAYDEPSKQLAKLENVTLGSTGELLTATVSYAYNTWAAAVGPVAIGFSRNGTTNTWKNSVTTSTAISQYLEFIFNDDVVSGAPGTTSKWFYEGGYFYYNGYLNPGQETVPLLKNVKFSEETPNPFQGAQYTLIPCLEAIQCTKAALTSTAGGGWGLLTGSEAYKALSAVIDSMPAA